MNDMHEISSRSLEELHDMLLSLRKELVKNVFNRKLDKSTDNSHGSSIKKKIARVLTELNWRKKGNNV
ncbi:50S ribosomal protein L29 [Neoehrlichia mikurensis]|nr:50S ribosomal protein L29 [Neoehrlichia mikurensis]QXK92412.1 50S ribosomal protein L29 [Neoehrlichia mikurensis]QXK93257.1 50S ribosomal protein L29 [Neoehrlichia mikurensis]QXK93489.1 50S ribosomal protein L29 [Neoehrlichia mikurensis]UTO56477.1 50S ribosomal protein L29 [Neoehrlichia mikurensis]